MAKSCRKVNVRGNAQRGLPHAQHDHNFLECGVAGAFADAIDGQFELPCAAADRGQGIGHAQAQIVVAVRA